MNHFPARSALLIAVVIAASLPPAKAQQSPPPVAQETAIPVLKQSIEVKAMPIEPAVDRRNSEVYTRTLFTRDDQVFHLLDAGISAGLTFRFRGK